MLSSRVGTVSCPGVDGHILPCAERCHMSGVSARSVSNEQRRRSDELTSVVIMVSVETVPVDMNVRYYSVFMHALKMKIKDAHVDHIARGPPEYVRRPATRRGRATLRGRLR